LFGLAAPCRLMLLAAGGGAMKLCRTFAITGAGLGPHDIDIDIGCGLLLRDPPGVSPPGSAVVRGSARGLLRALARLVRVSRAQSRANLWRWLRP
jgi:hypothetical protein